MLQLSDGLESMNLSANAGDYYYCLLIEINDGEGGKMLDSSWVAKDTFVSLSIRDLGRESDSLMGW